MEAAFQSSLRSQLHDRRHRLERVVRDVGESEDLLRLLKEVDSALGRMEANAFGLCAVCDETVEDELLASDPLLQYCLCDLSPEQQRRLERDLGLAAKIQYSLLPEQDLCVDGWCAHFRYQAAGPVSGDYCDLVARPGEGALWFLVGDVSGKGVAASLLMARLHALFRSLIDVGLPLEQLLERANRLFGETAPSSHYATLICGRALADGSVEVGNAGHPSALVVRRDGVMTLSATGFPVGMFGSGGYEVCRARLETGDSLVLYTDGLTESTGAGGGEYGTARLQAALSERHALSPARLADALLKEASRFREGAAGADDLTLMVIRRTG